MDPGDFAVVAVFVPEHPAPGMNALHLALETEGKFFLDPVDNITPAPPGGKDIIQEQLFQSKMVCFYDSEVRKPPKTWKQFVDSKFAEVKFSDTESSMMVLPSDRKSVV